eukprot:gene27657-31248_t
MAYTDINSEDRLVQATFAEHLERELGWDSVYAFNQESFGPTGTLGRSSEREAVLVRDLREALTRLNPQLPPPAIEDAVAQLTHHDFSRSLLQHNQAFHKLVRDGVPVSFKNAQGQLSHTQAKVIDFRNPAHNRFLVVRELKLTGLRTPNYNRRADLVCFVNGLPLVFIELKAVYKNIRAGFDGNLRDYMDENVVAHAFHHNAFLVVSNGHNARFGSITSTWEHFGEWKRLSENDVGNVAAEVLLNGMLAKDRLLDILENFILFDASKAGHTRKVVARNHQLLGVNQAVASVLRQETLKREFPTQLTQQAAADEPCRRHANADGDQAQHHHEHEEAARHAGGAAGLLHAHFFFQVEHLGEVVGGFACFVVIVLVVAVIAGRQLLERGVVVVPQARVLVQAGGDDGLAADVREILFDGGQHPGRLALRRRDQREHARRVAVFVVLRFGQHGFRIVELDHVHQRERHHVDVFDAAAGGVLRHQRVQHHLVILVVGRVAQDALDLALQL